MHSEMGVCVAPIHHVSHFCELKQAKTGGTQFQAQDLHETRGCLPSPGLLRSLARGAKGFRAVAEQLSRMHLMVTPQIKSLKFTLYFVSGTARPMHSSNVARGKLTSSKVDMPRMARVFQHMVVWNMGAPLPRIPGNTGIWPSWALQQESQPQM